MSHTEAVVPWPEEYLEYFRLFNERDFFEAHEVLEDLWVIEVDPLRDYYKGLIMLAVAILHWQRGNRSGAWRLYRDGMNYLEDYPEQYEGFALGDFRASMRGLFAPLVAARETAPPPSEASLPVLVAPGG